MRGGGCGGVTGERNVHPKSIAVSLRSGNWGGARSWGDNSQESGLRAPCQFPM
jgi:hypothetical protein